MKLSYEWLKELTGLDWPVEVAAQRLTLCGTNCEEVVPAARFMDRVIVGQVTEVQPINETSNLQLARVNIGSEILDSVCGAPNVAGGQKVAVALAGAMLEGDVEIEPTLVGGVMSSAVICSERETGISSDHSGIMILDDDAPVGAPLAAYLDFDDFIMSFELTPNRGDSMSAIGIARDLAALASVPLRRPQFQLKEAVQKTVEFISVRTEDPDGCPRYAARVIRSVRVGSSPWWVKKKLLMSGIRPISNVVDVTNLVMLETGHPLHAFDFDRFGSREVVVRRAYNGETFATLDGRTHNLDPTILLITNGRQPVAVAGVMGGLDSEVQEATTAVLLEAAYFDPAVIRGGRKRLETASESSQRFEKGVDPNGISFAIDRAAYLIADLSGGDVLSGIVDCYPRRIEPANIRFRPERCNLILGTHIPDERMKQIFHGLEFSVSGAGELDVTVPTFRPDIKREIDLIEEIARIEGYDAIPDAVTSKGPLYTPRHAVDVFSRNVRRVLTGAGFDEIVGHGLAQSRLSSQLNPDLRQVRLLDSVSDEFDIARNSLADTALTAISHNVAHRNLDLCLFEIGKVYIPANEHDGCREDMRLSLSVTGSTVSNWRDKPRALDFYDLSGALEQLSDHFRWPRFSFVGQPISFYDEDCSFRIVNNDRPAGVIGKISADILRKLDVKQPVYLAEVELDGLLASERAVTFQSLPQYPAAPRDLAIVVGADVLAGDLVASIRRTAGEWAESVRIFDLYTGEQIGPGKKSIAVSVVYRSSEGTMSSEQVDHLQQQVISTLKQEFNADIRDK
ncbi:MAG TPA: phenylalanine--tRNA ligase subunit beta [Candidatus Deferrimicrobium sp.]|nr:phenylalanine--tRNA ligase subunit beta [Candidatus Deferrimicrobium sp.]